MLLRSGPRCGHLQRASLLLLSAAPLLFLLLLSFIPVSASFPAHNRCPSPLDCAQQRRHHCQVGSSHCGSCLSPYRENDNGRCVLMTRHKNGKVTTFTDQEEEIDFLHSFIEKQEESNVKTTKIQLQKTASSSSHSDPKDSRTGTSEQRSRNQDQQSGKIPRSTTAVPVPAGTASPNTLRPEPGVTGADGRYGPLIVRHPDNDTIIVIVISLCVIVGTVAVILASVCYVKLRTESRLAEKVDYPAFNGPSLPNTKANSSMGDKTLAQSAQMYHYQHQKQQMLSMGNHKPEQKGVDTEATSDEEEVAGGFTVYECPGLAPTGEMEVKNPLFDDSPPEYQETPK